MRVAGEDCRALPFPKRPHSLCQVLGAATRCRSGQPLVSAADELKTSSGSRPVREPPAALRLRFVSAPAHALCLLDITQGRTWLCRVRSANNAAATSSQSLGSGCDGEKNFPTSPPPRAEQTLTALSDGY